LSGGCISSGTISGEEFSHDTHFTKVICYGFAAMMLSCFTASVCCADGPSDNTKSDASSVPPKVIKPEEAKDHAGEVVTVEFTVIAANEVDSGRCFLNSSTIAMIQKVSLHILRRRDSLNSRKIQPLPSQPIIISRKRFVLLAKLKRTTINSKSRWTIPLK